MAITAQEAWVEREREIEVRCPGVHARAGRGGGDPGARSEYVDQNSGVSARLPIALIENLVSNAERRALAHRREAASCARLRPAAGRLGGERQGGAGARRRAGGGDERGARAARPRREVDLRASASPTPTSPSARAAGRPRAGRGRNARRVRVPADARVVLERQPHRDRRRDAVSRVSEAPGGVKGLPELAERYLEPASAEEAAVAMELVLEGLHQHSMLSRERNDGSRHRVQGHAEEHAERAGRGRGLKRAGSSLARALPAQHPHRRARRTP